MRLANTIAVVLALTAVAASAQSSSNIVQTAAGDKNFSTLVAAVKAAGLVDALSGKGPFTVLAPTNEAFGRLPKGTLKSLLKPENRARLQQILKYHVISGRVPAKAVVKLRNAGTLVGQRVRIEASDTRVRINDATVTRTDVACSNGIIHIIDRVLIPTDENIIDVASKAGQFKTLLAAAKAAGLEKALSAKGPLTIFAPTDEAFAKLGKETINSLLRPENKGKLAAILSYHVVGNRIFADDALAAGSSSTLLKNADLNVSISDGRLRINDARVLANDLETANGVIHVIDSVLMPPVSAIPEPRGRKVIGVHLDRVGAALASQLKLDRDKTLLISSTTKNQPARKAGLEKYDIIVEIDGLPATNKNLAKAKDAHRVGEVLELVIIREGKRRHYEVPVGIEKH